MIIGVYHDRSPRVSLSVSGSIATNEIEFVLDTGFEGELVLPTSISRQIGGVYKGTQVRMLADGSFVECEICSVVVNWDGKRRQVAALVLEGNALLGSELFEGHHLDIEATEGGEVLIEML